MNKHDPLCPATLSIYVTGTGITPNECRCALIAAVKERIARAIEAAEHGPYCGRNDCRCQIPAHALIARDGG